MQLCPTNRTSRQNQNTNTNTGQLRAAREREIGEHRFETRDCSQGLSANKSKVRSSSFIFIMPIITFRDRRGNLVYHCGDGYAYFEATQHDHTKFLRCTQRAHWGCTGSATAEVNGDAGSVWRNKSAHTCTQDPLYPAVCTLKNYIIQEAKTRIDETPQQIYHRACAM